MDWHAHIRQAFGPTPPEPDVLDELAQHAVATYESARADGCDPDEARQRVDEQIGIWVASPTLLRRRGRSVPALVVPPAEGRGVNSVMQDLRYAFRLLRRQPGYTAVIVGTMALGIAAVGVLTSITYGVLLKPLPWAAAPRLVRLNETRQGNTGRFRPMMTNGTYLAWRDSVTTLDGLGAWSTDNETLTESGDPTRIRIGKITPSLLPLLGASPMLGRAFTDGEESPGRPPIALISYRLWQRRYGGRATIVGDSLRLDGTSYTVVGVMPASFAFPDRETQAWVPFYIMPLVSPTNPGSFSLAIFGAIGRLKLGVTPAQAASEGTTRGRAAPSAPPIMMAVFGTNGPVEVSVVPLLDALTADVRPAILIMFAAVMLLLTVATANVANLQLARGTTRRRELAIRAALGADGARLARQCLVENLLLGLLGGCVGVLLAAIVHTTLPSLLPADFPRLGDLAFDARVQGFTIAIALLAAVGFGLLPALQAARESLVQALTDDSLAPVGGGTRSPTSRARAVIMAMQVALACVLLVGATLLIRSFVALVHTDTGYDQLNVLTARLSLPDTTYSPERRAAALDRIGERLSSVPGVTRAAFGTIVPFSGGTSLSSFPLRRRDGSTVDVQTGVRTITVGYFAALGQRVIEGREFTTADGKGAPAAVIVNREFSRKFLEGRALGWSIAANEDDPDRTIIGVVEDAARRSVTDGPMPEIYLSLAQKALTESDVSVIVEVGIRSAGAGADVAVHRASGRSRGSGRIGTDAGRVDFRESRKAAPLCGAARHIRRARTGDRRCRALRRAVL